MLSRIIPRSRAPVTSASVRGMFSVAYSSGSSRLVSQWIDLRCQPHPRDRRGPEPRALLHAGGKPREQRHGRSLREDLQARLCPHQMRFPTPEARSRASITGWRITTLNTHTPVWATAHRGSTLHHSNQPRVRSNGVNSRPASGSSAPDQSMGGLLIDSEAQVRCEGS